MAHPKIESDLLYTAHCFKTQELYFITIYSSKYNMSPPPLNKEEN